MRYLCSGDGPPTPGQSAPSTAVARLRTCLPPQGVKATPSARVVVSRREVCGVEKVYGGGDCRGVGATKGG